MVWTLDLDDFSGTFCGRGQYPLIRYLKTCLGAYGAYGKAHYLNSKPNLQMKPTPHYAQLKKASAEPQVQSPLMALRLLEYLMI